MLRGPETVLGDAGSECELFCTEATEVRGLAEVTGGCVARRLQRPWAWDQRVPHFKEDDAFRCVGNDGWRSWG